MRRETLLKIMGLLRKDINRRWTILKLSKQLKIGYRPAYNHIQTLSKEKIINVNEVGRAKQCFLNLENAKCRHLLEEIDITRKEKLFKQNIKLRNVLESLISKLTEKFSGEIHSVVLFGSYAKSKATKVSDMDVLFVVSDIENKILREAIERESASFQYSHNIKISPIITNIKEFKKMLSARELNIGKEVKDSGLPLYGFEQFWRLIV